MAEPTVRFARTSDGVSIAYWTLGNGFPLLIGAPLAASHLSVEWQIGPLAQWYERLSRHVTVVRWDWRGSGLSDRDVDVSTETAERDLSAVVASAGLDNVDAIVPTGGLNEWMIGWAAHRPDTVSRLVLISPTLHGSYAPWRTPEYLAVRSLVDKDLHAWSEAHARATLGWQSTDPRVHAWAVMLRSSRGQADWQRFMRAYDAIDLSGLLPLVRAKTLVINWSSRKESLEHSRQAASAIAGSSFVDISSRGALTWYENRRVISAIERFLDLPATTAPPASAPGAAVIFFTDIADSTTLTEAIGDVAFREESRIMDNRVREAMRDHGGEAVTGKVLGDGVMGVFTSAAQAIAAARSCVDAASETPLRLHIGLHAGDVIREEDNVYGGAVNIASRICALCEPGEILVSQTVRDLARTSAAVSFEDRGEHALKGIEDPVRVFAVNPDRA